MATGTKIGDAFISLRLDRAQAEKDARSAGESISSIFKSAIKADAVEEVFTSAIRNAGNLNAAANNTRVIFGTAEQTVLDFGKTSATQFGLSTTAFLSASNALGHLLQNVGYTKQESADLSETVVQAGANLAAAFNRDTGDVIETLTRGIAGQTRGLKTLGIVLNEVDLKQEAERQGLYDGTGALDAHAKASASLALILQQTARFQGDFAATTDTAAQAQRIAKAETENASASLGQNFLPIYTKIVQIVGDAATVFGALPGPIQTGVLALAALIAFSGPIGSLVGVISDLAVAMAGLEISSGGILAILGIVAAAIGAFVLFGNSEDAVAASSKKVADSLEQATTNVVANRKATDDAITASEGLTDAQSALSAALLAAGDHGDRTKVALGALGFTVDDTARLYYELKAAGGVLVDSSADNVSALLLQKQAHLDVVVAMLEQKGISHEVAVSMASQASQLANGAAVAEVTSEVTKNLTADQQALVQALNDVGRGASHVDMQKVATDYLNAQAAGGGFNATLIQQAENQAHASRNSDAALAVYEAYVQILEKLTPEQIAQGGAATQAAVGMADLTDSTDAATSSTKEYDVAAEQLKQTQDANKEATSALADALKSSTNEFELAKAAADTFSKALDSVFSPALNLEKANEALNSTLDDIVKNVGEAKKGHDKLATSLDINTESGRKNRSSIQDQVTAIIDKTKADVASGVAVEDATAASGLYRQRLEETLAQLGFNTDEVHAYIDQLGLTPENVTTAVELDKDEIAKQHAQEWLDKLGDIPAEKATQIQANIDRGAYAAAEAALAQLSRNRPVLFVPSGNFASGDVAGGRNGAKSAAGRFIPGGSNLVTSTGEVGGPQGDEVILPLGDPGRMRELLGMPGVGSRVAGVMGGSGGMTAVHIDNAYFSDGADAEGLAQVVLFKVGAS
jgi:hypothetical protein